MTDRSSLHRHILILVGSTVGMAVSMAPMLAFTFSVFLKPLTQEFGWDRSTTASILASQSLALILVLPVLGALVDRVGVRRVLLPSLFGLGLLTASLSLLPGKLWVWYAVFLILVPWIGGGSGGVPYSRLLTEWFDRRRGIALGISASGVGIGTLIFVPFAQSIIDAYTWRHAYAALGAVILLVGFPIVALTIRNTPVESNLRPDSGRTHLVRTSTTSVLSGQSLAEAAREKTLWLIISAFFIVGAVILGATIHLTAMFTDKGVDGQTAALMVSVLGGVSMIARMVVGLLFDRYHAPNVAIVFFLGPVIAFLILASGTNCIWMGFLSAALLGCGLGAEIDLIAYLCSRYFGKKQFGKIYGLLLGVFQVGGSLGPVVVGYAYDVFGAYTVALYASAGIMLVACVLLLALGPYPAFGRVAKPVAQHN
jgi:MFS family permease